MELQDLTITHFHNHLNATAEAAEILPSQVTLAAQLLFGCLINDGKILICGEGHHNANGAHMCNALISRFGQDRPALPAIHIGANSPLMSTMAHQHPKQEMYARQIAALGQTNDVLMILAGSQESSASTQAVQTAHSKDMLVITITPQVSNKLKAMLSPSDIDIGVPGQHFATILQQQLMVVLILCDLIDVQLFGSHV